MISDKTNPAESLDPAAANTIDGPPFRARPDIMTVALTGTPGTGKTTVSRLLAGRGYRVLDLTAFIRQNHIPSEQDAQRDCLVVDMDALEKTVTDYIAALPAPSGGASSVLLIDSHMAHYLCGTAIVFRTHPSLLQARLKSRQYTPEKIHENMMSEALDIILCESYDWCGSVLEIDNSQRSPEESADAVEEIISSLIRIRDEEASSAPADPSVPDRFCVPDGAHGPSAFADTGVEIFTDGIRGAPETPLEKDAVLRKYLPGSIDWSDLAD